MATLVHGNARDSIVAASAQLRMLRRLAAMMADTLGDCLSKSLSNPGSERRQIGAPSPLDEKITEMLLRLAETEVE